MESSPPHYDWTTTQLNHNVFAFPPDTSQVHSGASEIHPDPFAAFNDRLPAPYPSSTPARHTDATALHNQQTRSGGGRTGPGLHGSETWIDFLRDSDNALDNDARASTNLGHRQRRQGAPRVQASDTSAYSSTAHESSSFPVPPISYSSPGLSSPPYIAQDSFDPLNPRNHFHRDLPRSSDQHIHTVPAPFASSASKRTTTHEENKKRRLPDSAPSGREGDISGTEAAASRPRMSQPGIIDLTSSPPAARPGSHGRGPSSTTETLGRRRSSLNVGFGEAMRLDATIPSQQPSTAWSPPATMPIQNERPQSDVVLPRWQPDSEVNKCPVCNNQFGFFYRKHHCRKCGRVVCANCSPHRITMPHQYIVQPDLIDLTYDDGDESPQQVWRYGHVGGGAQVRVCNPCVPDPNLSPPPQPPPYESGDSHAQPSDDSWLQGTMGSETRGPQWYNEARRPPQAAAQLWMQNSNQQQPTRSSLALNDPAGADPFRDGRVTFNNPSSTSDLFPPFGVQRQRHPSILDAPLPPPPGPRPPRQTFTAFAGDQLTAPRNSSRIHRSHHSASDVGLPPPPDAARFRAFMGQSPPNAGGLNSPLPGLPRGQRIAPRLPPGMDVPGARPPPPRRQIAEEDECPVCGNELPPKGPNGEEAAREQHVEECIASHFAPSGHSRASNNATRPADPTRPDPTLPQNFPTGASSSAPTSLPPGNLLSRSYAGSSSVSSTEPPRPRRATGTRMLAYTATEKDCVGEEGEAAECIICFEEFEPGVELGRLECLCKFHRACIRQWWDTKGVGSCPTHQLHD